MPASHSLSRSPTNPSIKPEQATVFVVDDDDAMRDSLRWLIESAHRNVKTYSSAQEFLDAYDAAQPGCLVLDLRMPGMTGLELQEQLAARNICIPIIFVTAHGTIPTAVRAVQGGAADFITKPFDNQTLLDRIERSIARDHQFRREQAKRERVAARLALLTRREREVMERVIAGKSNKLIAVELHISGKTVEAHRARVMEKMQASSVAQLVRLVLTQQDH